MHVPTSRRKPRIVISLFVVAVLFTGLLAQAQWYSNATVGINGNLNGFRPFTSTSAWNTTVTNSPVDSTTPAWQAEVKGNYLHPDFDNAGSGIPYTVVDSSVAGTGLHYVASELYPSDSDITLTPFPSTFAVEGGLTNCQYSSQAADPNDNHALFFDRATGYIYEFWQFLGCNGTYTAGNEAVWDSTVNQLRPFGMTSADAAGLSVFAGLVKYEEAYSTPVYVSLNGVMVPTLGHAIRFTMPYTRCASYSNGDCNGGFVLPATHAAANNSGTNNYMGMRIRLSPTYDVFNLSGASKVIAYTMQTYGMILADNGSYGYFQGTSDSRWTSNDSNELKTIPLTAFSIIAKGTVYTAASTPPGSAPTNTKPVANPSTILIGQCSTITWTSSGSLLDYLQGGPPGRGSATVCPTTTTAYPLNSENETGDVPSPRPSRSPSAHRLPIPAHPNADLVWQSSRLA